MKILEVFLDGSLKLGESSTSEFVEWVVMSLFFGKEIKNVSYQNGLFSSGRGC